MARGSLTRVFGRILRNRRLKAGLTQEALAFEAGVHPTYVSLLERGARTPSLQVVSQLAHALKTTMTTLVRDVEQALGAR